MIDAPTREATTTGPAEVLIREARRRGRRHRLAVGFIVFAVLSVAAVAAISLGSGENRKGSPAPTKTTVPAPVVLTNAPRCTAPLIRVAYQGALEGAGSWNYLFTMRNVGDGPCSLAGFPAVRFLTTTGSAISVQTGYTKGECGKFGCGIGGLRNHGVFPRAVLAAHTGVASFFIEGVDVSTGKVGQRQTVCEVVPKLQVELPQGTIWHNVSNWAGRALYPCGAVAVLPLVPGRSGTFPSVPLWTIGGASGS